MLNIQMVRTKSRPRTVNEADTTVRVVARGADAEARAALAILQDRDQ